MIVPIFLMNRGCPHRCIFCNTRQIAGKDRESLTEDHIRRTVARYAAHRKTQTEPVALAFYGGNFTGMGKGEQERLLSVTDGMIRDEMIHEVRMSTRPDDLTRETLDMLKRHGVGTIEIGVQSMNDRVLELARRGHTVEDVTRAVRLAKDRGIIVGLHLMAGLPGDSEDTFADSLQQAIDLKPDMVRLHPTLVFADTVLAEMFHAEQYTPLSLSSAVRLCKRALVLLEKARIPLIRLGLLETDLMRTPGSVVAGPVHPAFRSLVEASLFMDMAVQLLQERAVPDHGATFSVSPRDVSSFRGEKNGNIRELKRRFDLEEITVRPVPELERGTLVLSDGMNAVSKLRRTYQF